MSNMITTIVIAIMALVGLVNTSLINAGNLTTYNFPELQRNNGTGNGTIFNSTETRTSCYSSGEQWNDLGNWQHMFNSLQISGVMRVHDIPAGYHISDKIPVGDHCYVYEVGISKGHAYPVKEDYNKGLNMVYACARGGKQDVKFVGRGGGIIAEGWVKGDPQSNPDCSGE